jgi:hypothetical protein
MAIAQRVEDYMMQYGVEYDVDPSVPLQHSTELAEVPATDWPVGGA